MDSETLLAMKRKYQIAYLFCDTAVFILYPMSSDLKVKGSSSPESFSLAWSWYPRRGLVRGCDPVFQWLFVVFWCWYDDDTYIRAGWVGHKGVVEVFELFVNIHSLAPSPSLMVREVQVSNVIRHGLDQTIIDHLENRFPKQLDWLR